MNDTYVGELYAEKQALQRKLLALSKEHRELKHQFMLVDSQRHSAVNAHKKAVANLKLAPSPNSRLRTEESLRDKDVRIKQTRAIEHSLTKRLQDVTAREEHAVHVGAELKSHLQTTARDLGSMRVRKERADAGLERLSERLKQKQMTLEAETEKLVDTQKALDATRDRMIEISLRADTAEDGLQVAEAALAESEGALAESENSLAALDESFLLQCAKTAPKRGRPAGHRGADWLLANWAGYNANSRKVAFWRHCEDIRDALKAADYENWLPSAVAVVLDSTPAGDSGSWVDLLWASRQFARRRNDLIGQLRGIAQSEWGVDLAQYAITEVGLSTRQYQRLRNAFSRSLFTPSHSTLEVDPRAGMFSPRPWYTCPLTGKVFNLPEPLPPLYTVQALMKHTLAPMGLHLSQDGRISERSFLDTLRQTFVRDQKSLKVFDMKRPAHPCFGIDHLTISGARDFTQGGLTMGGCYKSGALLSEQKHVTLCVGLHHDDGKGLEAMLGPKEASESAGEKRPAVVGIASEFAQLSDSGTLDMGDGTTIPCEPVICLDFAAFRGITQKRGKCSALCACRGLEKLQSRPGYGGIPDLPEGNTIADFHAAQAIARSQCAYGTAKMELPSLQDATHRLPPGWDFDRDGPWSCSWCEAVIYTAPGQQLAAETELAALRARATTSSDPADRKAAKKELDEKLKVHADEHGDALLLQPLILTHRSGTKVLVLDPMHCLELNLLKTLWKYAFGDRMTAEDREEVAEYLNEIGLHLDIQEKGKRNPSQKWFSAAQVDEFVLGAAHFKHSKSPGLVKNVLAIVERIFDQTTVAQSLEAAADPPPKKSKATSRKDRHTAPVAGGYGAGEVAAARAQGVDMDTGVTISGLKGASGESGEGVRTYIRERYGNESALVVQILTAFEAYGELFAEWRAVWESDTDEYRAQRALQFARCARDFMAALNSLSNYKQKSWYTHMVVWVAWQQIFFFGNTWPLSTISIESRNARLKRYGLRFTNWRPLVQGYTSYSYTDRRSGKEITSQRRYNSSAVHQLLQRTALAEKSWHTNSRFTATDKMRLMTQLRSSLIKVEVADTPPSLPPVTMLSELVFKS